MPFSVTASLFSGAVTIASAPPFKQSWVAMRTYSTAARHSARPVGRRRNRRTRTAPRHRADERARAARQWRARPFRGPVRRPPRSHDARPDSAGSARAFSTTSGPIPAGSPMVRAITGKSFGMEIIRYVDQIVWRAESAGFGDTGNPSKTPPWRAPIGMPGANSRRNSIARAPKARHTSAAVSPPESTKAAGRQFEEARQAFASRFVHGECAKERARAERQRAHPRSSTWRVPARRRAGEQARSCACVTGWSEPMQKRTGPAAGGRNSGADGGPTECGSQGGWPTPPTQPRGCAAARRGALWRCAQGRPRRWRRRK